MRCEDLHALLSQMPLCEETDLGARAVTHCLYPSSDPVAVCIAKRRVGYHVTDGGGAMRSAIIHGAGWKGIFEKACKRYSVQERAGALVAEPPSDDWLYPAILAVSNASAMAARNAVDVAASKTERGLKAAIFEQLKRVVPESKIAKNYEFRGRSGHVWGLDFAVREETLVLIKSVVQNGNSINSSYAAFGDIGEQENVSNFCVHDGDLASDSATLLRQVADLVPLAAVSPMIQQRAYRHRLS